MKADSEPGTFLDGLRVQLPKSINPGTETATLFCLQIVQDNVDLFSM